MKTVSELIKQHSFKVDDGRYDQLSKSEDVSYKTMSLQGAWQSGHPKAIIYIATCAGVLPPEQLRLFALWNAIGLNELAIDSSCREAIRICREYYEKPNPSNFVTSLDLISSPSATMSYVKEIPINQRTLDIFLFDLAEFGHKNWMRLSEIEDRLCSAVQSAVKVLSEAHVIETGFVTKQYNGENQTIANTDNFLLGMAQTAWMTAHCALQTLGFAAQESHMRSCKSEEDEEAAELEVEKAVKKAESEQANWLRENASPNFSV